MKPPRRASLRQAPIRLAVIGTGHLGRIHARLAAELSSVDLVAVVDPLESARLSVAASTGSRPVADYQELVGEIDAAIVATPTSTHLRVAGELMQAGVHVLVEKPLAPTLDESQQLVQLARKNNLTLQVGHVERFNPALTSVQDKIGDPKFIDAVRTSGYTFRSTDIGVVMDLMIHDIDVILSLVKSTVEKVDAVGISVLGDHEDMANVRLSFDSGCVAMLTASRVSYKPQRTMQVFTSRIFTAIDFAARRSTWVEPNESVLRREFLTGQLTPEERQDYRENLFSNLLTKTSTDSKEINAIEQEQRDFASAICENRRPLVDGADGRDAVAVAELILEAIDRHQWDGSQLGRQGPLAMPALPILGGAERWFSDSPSIPQRKAG